MANRNLTKAKKHKNDEFYTQFSDIEKEIKHYKEQFKDKTVFCNCDNPIESHFWNYFYLNFKFLGLNKLISTHYDSDNPTYKLEYNGLGKTIKTKLIGNGDFRSNEVIDLLMKCDIVVTNPPFSLFRDYMKQLIDFKKLFLIIGSQNAITYKETFCLLKESKVWLGHNSGSFKFRVPYNYEGNNLFIDESGNKLTRLGNITWFTNLEVNKRSNSLKLYKKYNKDEYPHYDNYNAINISKVANIPIDYNGVMGVPITFMDKHNPEQFEILGIDRYMEDNPNYEKRFKIKDKEIYARILIKKK